MKCGDYFQAEDRPRELGNISLTCKWAKTTETSLVLRHFEVNHREVGCFSAYYNFSGYVRYLSLQIGMGDIFLLERGLIWWEVPPSKHCYFIYLPAFVYTCFVII